MSIQNKLFRRFTALFLIVLTILGATLIIVQRVFSIKDAAAANLNIFGTLYSQAEGIIVSKSAEENEKELRLICKKFIESLFTAHAELIVYDETRSAVYCSNPNITLPEGGEYKPQDEYIYSFVIDKKSVISARVFVADEAYYLIYIADISEAYVRVQRTAVILIGVESILIFAVVFLIRALSKQISRPLLDLSERIRETGASGRYIGEITTTDILEIQQLSHSFNLLSREIETKIEDLNAQNEAKQRFINGLTHEIRTPLTSIIGYSSLLIQSQPLPEIYHSSLQIIHDNGLRIQTLTENMVKLLSSSKDDLKIEDVVLNDLLNEIGQDYKKRFEEADAELTVCGDELRLYTDRGLLRILISNIVDNAVKAVSDCSERHIILSVANLTLTVSDTGKGISTEDLDKIFEPFFMADKSRKHTTGGFGFGLALSESIARRLGITIRVKSKLGSGTEFTLTFSEEMNNFTSS